MSFWKKLKEVFVQHNQVIQGTHVYQKRIDELYAENTQLRKEIEELILLKPSISTEQAVMHICRELKADKGVMSCGFYDAYQSSIALAFYDECRKQKIRISHKNLHKVSNDAADRFLKLWIDGSHV